MKERSLKPMLIDQLETLINQVGQPTDQLAEDLAELSEAFQEANFTGMGELLALMSELVSSEETALTPEHQADICFILAALSKQESLDALLSATTTTLTSPSWRSPLGAEDLTLLPELLAEEWGPLTEIEIVSSPGKATQLLEQASSCEDLSEHLVELSESLPDEYPPLISDLCALSAELCSTLESLGHPYLPSLFFRIDHLLAQPNHEHATAVLIALSDSHWSNPVTPEEQQELQALIDEAFRPTEQQNPNEPDTIYLEEDVCELSSAAGPATSALNSASSPEELSELLIELSESLSEIDPTLISDLFALSSESCGTLDETHTPAAVSLCQLLDLLLQAPDKATCKKTIDFLADEQWPTPLSAEEQFELCALADIAFAPNELPVPLPAGEAHQQEPKHSGFINSEAPKEILEKPDFCNVNMSLLEQAGPKIDPQILTMLSGSLMQLTQLWEQTAANSNPNLLEASMEALLPLERACETVHLSGVRILLEGLGRNLSYMALRRKPLEEYEHEHFTYCLEALQAHLGDLGNKSDRDSVVDAISDPALPIYATNQQSAFLTGLLALAGIQSSEDIEQQHATHEDIDLSIADDIDPQLLEMLYGELPTLVDELQQCLQTVITDQEAEYLLSAQRAAHTIKGLANMAGIRGLAQLTHCMEEILETLTNSDILPGKQLSEDLTESVDCLAQMSEAISESEPNPDGALEVLQCLMDWHYRLKTEGVEAAGQTRQSAEKLDPEKQAIKKVPSTPLSPSKKEITKPGESEQAGQLRVPVSLLDNLFRIAGESSTLNAQLDERLSQMHRLARANRDRQRALQKVMFDIEQQLLDYFTLHPSEASDDSDFDPLEMDRYHSIHTTLSQLQEAVADVREVGHEMAHHLRQLDEMHASQTNLQKESLDNVLSTRLVAVKTLTSRMQRIMRQACRAAGKEARLIIEGENVLVDSQILSKLADPLMHIIRNAVDHGLEASDVRADTGKDTVGTLTISFRQAENQIQVSCSDDGSGINVNRVKEIAERKGLLTDKRELSDNEAQRLILIPGFSTRDEVSQLSGRGIGMDVVYQQVTRLQGTISIHSVQNEGTRFDLALPASSLLIHTLLVRSANKRIHALSSHTIEQSLLSADGEINSSDDGMTFTTAEGVYPAYTLETLLGEKPGDYSGKRLFPVLLVKLDQGEKAAVFVPEVLAHREQVFKSMGEHLPDIPGVPGVTILADGSVAPIVDLQGRIRQRHSALSPVSELAEPEFNLHLPEVLVVDDSLSARKTLATLLSDSGYEVRTAIDGLDALDKIRQEPPAIVLTDLEMPRMSGMELAAILRNSKQYNNIPVVMITSRSTHKHRGEAEAAGVSAYLTKPWTETQVLDQVQTLLF